MANQIARIRNKIILLVSITMVIVPVLLLLVVPIVSDLTAETTRSTWFNFALLAPLLLIGVLFALRWYLRPISDLGYALEMGSTPTIELVTRARRIAFDAPIYFYALATIGMLVLSLVANLIGTFLWAGYLFQEHLIPSLLMTTIVANVALVIALVSRRWMRPVLLYTATRVQEGGTRIGIRTRLLVTMLTLILLALVFPGALGVTRVAKTYRDGLATRAEQLLAQALLTTAEISQPSERLDRIAQHLDGQLEYEMLFTLDENGAVHDPRYLQAPLTFSGERWSVDKPARFRQARGSFVLLPTTDTEAGPAWLGLGYIVHPLHSSDVIRTIVVLGASGAVACAVALLTSHYLASDIADNLIDVTQRLRDVANGEHVDLSTHVPVVSLDEVGDLVLAYNALQKRVRLQQEQIEQKQRELSALQSLSYKIGTVRDTDYLMNEVIRDVERAFGYHNVSILIKEPGHELLTFAATGLTDQRLRDRRFQIGEDGVVGRVAATGEPLLINDVSKCDFYISDNTNTRSELAVPMIVGDQVLGVFNVSSERTGAFDDNDVRIVTALSNQIAIAIENARLLDTVLGSTDELERRARNLTILHNVSTALSTSLRLEDVLRVVTEQMVTLFEIGHCVVLLFTEEDEYVEIAAEHPARGWTGQQIQLKAFPLIQRVLAAPKPLVFADTQRSEQLRPLRENLQNIDARTVLTVPLIAKGRVEGLVILSATGEPRPFTPEEMDICVTIASQVAVSVENVRLIESLRLQATALADMARDVTAERSQLDAILRNLVDGLLVTDPEGRIILHNPAFLHLFGLNEQEIRDRIVSEIIPEMPLQNLVIQTIRAQVAHVQEMTLSDGRYFQITAAGVREEDELRVIIMVLRDVTRERQMDEMKTRFFSTVSHEFRTPLTPILGFTKLIRKSLTRSILPLLPPDEQSAQRAANRIDQNAGIIIDQVTRLSKLVDDVLFLADLDAGRLKWKSKEVDVGQVLSALADEFRPIAQEKGLGMHTDWPADLPTVVGDASRLTRATRNLLDNAVKFTESGTVSVRAAHYRGDQDQDPPLGLHIPGELIGPNLLVAVSDTGPGISPEAQQTLFERFGQGLRDLLTDKPSGTGLGLALSKEIINHHGGSIWVETEKGQGSTFAFALPLASQDIELEVWGEKIALPETAPTILVVDDEPAVRELLHYVLLRAGYRTLMAVDGPTALNMARYHKPDLIILDIMIPGISGLDVTSVLKADAATKQIPIIILSIIADEEKAAELGANACFSKPFDQKALIDTIAKLIYPQAKRT